MKEFWQLLLVLAFKALVVTGLILYAGIGLGPDEAQYWTWSQQLDWGYYSKPPGIAWLIWGGTKLFGNTEFGVRFCSITLSILLSLAVYFLALACKTRPRTAFWAGVIMALSPLGIISSYFAITDVGMVLFWTLACAVMAHALSDMKAPNYYLLGFLIALGALFKWPIYFFWLFIPACAFYRNFINVHAIGGVLISLLGLVPSLIWNLNHDWATFRHVSATVTGHQPNEIGISQLPQGNFINFLGAQAALLSPVLFVLLVISFAVLVKRGRKIPPALLFCGWSSFIVLAGFSVFSLFQKMQGNWSDFAYPTGIVFMTWYFCENHSNLWLKIGVLVSILLAAVGFSIPTIQAKSWAANYPIAYKLNPFRQNIGWDNLQSVLLSAGYDPAKDFLIGDKYQSSSILSFYGPQQKRAYFLNLNKIRHNQFSYWPGLKQEQLGQTGYFVVMDNEPALSRDLKEKIAFYKGALSQYFDSVEYVGIQPLFHAYSTPAKQALIFKCVGYNGLEPAETSLY